MKVKKKKTSLHKLLIGVSILSIFGVSLLFSANREASGFGPTKDLAIQNALHNLATSIQTRIVSTTIISESEQITSQSTVTDSQYSSTIELKTDLEIDGYKILKESQTDDGYQAVVGIDASFVPHYLNKLKNIKNSIEFLEKEQKESDLTEENRLNLLLSYYDRYDTYSYLVKSLNNAVEIPELLNTKVGVELDLLNLITRKRQAIEAEIARLTPHNSSLLKDEAKEQLDELIANLEKLNQELREIQASKTAELARIAQNTNRAIANLAEEMRNRAEEKLASIKKDIQAANPETYIEGIERNKRIYTEIAQERDAEISNERKKIHVEYAERIEELKNQPFRAGELVNNEPTEFAKTKRLNDIQGLEEEQAVKEARIKEILSSSVQGNLDSIMKQIEFESSALEERAFGVSSLNDDVSIGVGEFDGNRGSWPVGIRFNILGVDMSFDFYVSYENVTGDKIPILLPTTDEESRAYYKFLDNVDLFNAFFLGVETPFVWEFDYVISPSSFDSNYEIIPRSYRLKRSDSFDVLMHQDEKELAEQYRFYEYEPTTKFMMDRLSFIDRYEIQKEQDKKQQQREETKRLAREKKYQNPNNYLRQGIFFSASPILNGDLYLTEIPDDLDTEESLEMTDVRLLVMYQMNPHLYTGIGLGFTIRPVIVKTEGFIFQPKYSVEQEESFAFEILLGAAYPLHFSKMTMNPYIEGVMGMEFDQLFVQLRAGVSFNFFRHYSLLWGLSYKLLGREPGAIGFTTGFGYSIPMK